MSKNEKDVSSWDELAQKHELLFGKKPRKNMKLENLRKKVEEKEGKSETEDDSYDSQDIAEKMTALLDAVKVDAEKDDGRPVMIALAATKKGVHMSMVGEGQDVAIMIATAMSSQPAIHAVVANAAMMSQMMHASQGEAAPEDLPKPQTQA